MLSSSPWNVVPLHMHLISSNDRNCSVWSSKHHFDGYRTSAFLHLERGFLDAPDLSLGSPETDQVTKFSTRTLTAFHRTCRVTKGTALLFLSHVFLICFQAVSALNFSEDSAVFSQ